MTPSRRSFLRWSGVALVGGAGCLDSFGTPGSRAALPDDAPDALRWAYKTPGEVRGQPAVTEDAVYVPSNRLFALNHDGTKRWSVETADRVTGSPAVADAVYFEDRTPHGSRGDAVRAVEFDGSDRWTFEPDRSGRLLGVADGLAYVEARTDFPKAELYAVNAETGDPEWTATVGVHSEMAVRGDSAYVVSDRVARAFATDDGTERWEWTPDPDSRADASNGTLAGVRDGTVVVAGGSSVVALDAADGSERWAVADEGVTFEDAILHDDAAFVAHHDAVSAFGFGDGTRRWRSAKQESKHSFVAGVADGTVYTSGRSGAAAVDADAGETRWMWADGDDASDAEIWEDALYVTGDSRIAAIGTDGEERWRFRMRNADSSLSRQNVSDLGGYVGSRDGTVYAFET